MCGVPSQSERERNEGSLEMLYLYQWQELAHEAGCQALSAHRILRTLADRGTLTHSLCAARKLTGSQRVGPRCCLVVADADARLEFNTRRQAPPRTKTDETLPGSQS
mgnify:CR=1 FL=1